ncbi:hypothetical protein [Amycolatopsis sp. Hca4]|uniref:hypothetical protein n=1 Tax=Amycolatopsis sp. Hca4 TaxID=2742131 RepID=UPI0015922652|nr:hypothetical protein [Amycolatopsis sp. Hca4]QKV74711.1 hypothetical protein HUT10_13725 [Amycolatopsis sp. Hca4]
MRRVLAAVGVAAGFALLSPITASAAEKPENPTMKVTVSGSVVTISAVCDTAGTTAEGGYAEPRGHEPIGWGVMKASGKKRSITFTGVRPGNYVASMYCHEGGPGSGGAVRNFTVGKPVKPPVKTAPQVAVKPQGAPQTGGGPADDESGGVAPLVAGGGALALLGAGGAVALRRRAARG